MLAYAAAPRYRDPWDCRGEKLPQVDLNALLLEIEASGRPIHQQAAVRRAMGLPVTNPGLERTLKEKGFWPEEARPLDFDIADLLYMQPREHRATVYGILMGLPVKEIAKQLGLSTGHTHLMARSVQERLHMLAEFFGMMGDGTLTTILDTKAILTALGTKFGISAGTLARATGLPWGGITREKFIGLWPRLTRWDDLRVHHDYTAQRLVTMEEIRLRNAGVIELHPAAK